MKLALTAYGTAFLKAVEALTDPTQRLFEDSYSFKFLPFLYRLAIHLMKIKSIYLWMIKQREKMTPGLMGAILCRNRYIDDVLLSSIKDEFQAVVNLGAGFDSRAFRIQGIQDLKVYEVDHPLVLEEKKDRIRKSRMTISDNLVFVSVDFDHQSLGNELVDSGYQASEKTIFIMEGVTQYITKEAFRSTIEYIAKASKGSRFIFTYALVNFLNQGETPADCANLSRLFKLSGFQSMKGYSPEEIKTTLNEFGIFIKEEVGADEYQQRYLLPLHRKLAVLPVERTVCAEVG
jgi:methyltransferase (TIGR00027 family)